jgi:hypothetical protein
MKRALAIAALATALLAGAAVAQSPTSPPSQNDRREAPIPNRSIKLTAEQGYVIKENVMPGGHAADTTGSSTGNLEIGGKAPASATLQDFPELVRQKVPAVRNYKFLIASDQVVIVDPKDNTIADILK